MTVHRGVRIPPWQIHSASEAAEPRGLRGGGNVGALARPAKQKPRRCERRGMGGAMRRQATAKRIDRPGANRPATAASSIPLPSRPASVHIGAMRNLLGCVN